jgi:pyruvate formate-lyase activating enzyme-like uncharacterized protein
MEQKTLGQMDELVKDYVQYRRAYEDIKKLSSDAYKTFKDKELLVVKALDDSGKNQYKLEKYGTFSLVSKETVKTPKTIESKVELFDYISDKYGTDALTGYLSIHSATLNSFYKEELKNAEDKALFSLPGLEDPTVTQTVSFRKA